MQHRAHSQIVFWDSPLGVQRNEVFQVADTDEQVIQSMPRKRKRLNYTMMVLTEMAFIIFLFYANLLMGQFTQNNIHRGETMSEAINNIFSLESFEIAVICAVTALGNTLSAKFNLITSAEK